LFAIAAPREAPVTRAETGGATGLSDGRPIRARQLTNHRTTVNADGQREKRATNAEIRIFQSFHAML
jgi:hypothetical protein